MKTNKKKQTSSQVIAVPFSKNENNLDNYRNCKAYILKVKCMKKEKLTREEKNYITQQINNNHYYKDSICFMGWRYDFSDYLRTYIIKSKFDTNTWYEIKGIDKTSIRATINYKITKIIDITNL